jgi:hypothetical protein
MWLTTVKPWSDRGETTVCTVVFPRFLRRATEVPSIGPRGGPSTPTRSGGQSVDTGTNRLERARREDRPVSSGDWESYQHHDAGKQAHEGRLKTALRRISERLRGDR